MRILPGVGVLRRQGGTGIAHFPPGFVELGDGAGAVPSMTLRAGSVGGDAGAAQVGAACQ